MTSKSDLFIRLLFRSCLRSNVSAESVRLRVSNHIINRLAHRHMPFDKLRMTYKTDRDCTGRNDVWEEINVLKKVGSWGNLDPSNTDEIAVPK